MITKKYIVIPPYTPVKKVISFLKTLGVTKRVDSRDVDTYITPSEDHLESYIGILNNKTRWLGNKEAFNGYEEIPFRFDVITIGEIV